MAVRKKRKAKVAVKRQDPWHLDFAFTLGQTVRAISSTVGSTMTAVEKNLEKASESIDRRVRRQIDKTKVKRVKPVPNSKEAALSPILKEVSGIADVSGFTAALRKMNEIGLRHSDQPGAVRIFSKLQQLSPSEQEGLARNFIDRLNAHPFFSNAMMALPVPGQVTEEASQKMQDAFMECLSQTLCDAGLAREEQELLKQLTDEMMRPLKDLVQLYTKPKTFSQKMKRLWRMQRIFIKTIKLIHLASIAGPRAEMASGDFKNLLASS